MRMFQIEIERNLTVAFELKKNWDMVASKAASLVTYLFYLDKVASIITMITGLLGKNDRLRMKTRENDFT